MRSEFAKSRTVAQTSIVKVGIVSLEFFYDRDTRAVGMTSPREALAAEGHAAEAEAVMNLAAKALGSTNAISDGSRHENAVMKLLEALERGRT